MKSPEIRNAFVDYFKRNGHAHVGSSSLIPENDPTLLFANAGMNQFKNLFLGLEQRDYKRAVTVQKCVRAGGKHNDLENVGFTARHHTFFEMLGNFSFGDYFKKDAIHFAWELLTKDLAIPKDKLYVTVFETDDEAADIWHKQEGVPRDRIFRLGEKDNFWRMGEVGPCGPCSEIFFDHGPLAGKESDPYKGIVAGEDRFVEIWNLVFMQFEETAPGKMNPLPKPSVDTGSGLERVVAALQGRYNNYNTDLFSGIIQNACDKLGWSYEEMVQGEMALRKDPSLSKVMGRDTRKFVEDLAALRVLADHTRSTSFLLTDGALPANEGRGYVLRRILRRAVHYGRKLSEKHSFLPDMAEVLIKEMSAAYPELKSRREHVLGVLKDEEQRFLQTLDTGTSILNDEVKKAKSKGMKALPGEVVFRLYDSFGFPADLTRVVANEQGLEVDEAAFDKEMETARARSKASWKGKAMASDEAHLVAIAQKTRDATKKDTAFTGYDGILSEGKLLTLSDGSKEVAELAKGATGVAILDKTPFYAEGGGQVGDKGTLRGPAFKALVHDTTKQNGLHLHHIEITEGVLKTGATVTAEVDDSERRNTMAHHSATHLMHAALRKVLGTHVTQAGSTVDAHRLRFDFTHNKGLTPQEIAEVERLVNEQISKGVEVRAESMPHKDAISKGAMALFGEKYGDEVRVLTMGDFSCELCGGTHVKNTSQIRVFKIVSEGGVSSGVRRIEALTADEAVKYLMDQTAEALRAQHAAGTKDVSAWIEDRKSQIKALEREIKKIQGGTIDVDGLASKAATFKSKAGDAKLVFADLDLDDREVLAQVTDQLKNKIQKGIVVVVGKGEGSHPIIVSVSKDLTGEYKAGDLLKEAAALMGGKGGGRPDFAQGAAPDRSKLPDVQTKLNQLLQK